MLCYCLLFYLDFFISKISLVSLVERWFVPTSIFALSKLIVLITCFATDAVLFAATYNLYLSLLVLTRLFGLCTFSYSSRKVFYRRLRLICPLDFIEYILFSCRYSLRFFYSAYIFPRSNKLRK